MPITRRFSIAILALTITVAGVSVVWLTHPAKARAQNGCSASTIQGTFGYTFEGVVGGVPTAGAGQITYDGSGNATGGDTGGNQIAEVVTDPGAVIAFTEIRQ